MAAPKSLSPPPPSRPRARAGVPVHAGRSPPARGIEKPAFRPASSGRDRPHLRASRDRASGTGCAGAPGHAFGSRSASDKPDDAESDARRGRSQQHGPPIGPHTRLPCRCRTEGATDQSRMPGLTVLIPREEHEHGQPPLRMPAVALPNVRRGRPRRARPSGRGRLRRVTVP